MFKVIEKVNCFDVGRAVQVFGEDGQARAQGEIITILGEKIIISRPNNNQLELIPIGSEDDRFWYSNEFDLNFKLFWM